MLSVKICGLREPENIKAVVELSPDWIGLIFYPASQRYLDPKVAREVLLGVSTGVKIMGVFVDAPLVEVADVVKEISLTGVQLHGTESPKFCEQLKSIYPELIIWKAFGVDGQFNFVPTDAYQRCCDALLFDTRSELLGGSGTSFSWDLLRKYEGSLPFWLSGGIGPENISRACTVAAQLPHCIGIDVNSKVEKEPGVKSEELVSEVLTAVRSVEHLD